MKREQKILVIDDNESIRRSFCQFLRLHGYVARAAASGEAALALLKKEDIDLALIDAVMPQEGGIEIIRKMQGTGIKVRIILMSAYIGRYIAGSGVPRGTWGFLSKPIKPRALLAALRVALETEPECISNERETIR